MSLHGLGSLMIYACHAAEGTMLGQGAWLSVGQVMVYRNLGSLLFAWLALCLMRISCRRLELALSYMYASEEVRFMTCG